MDIHLFSNTTSPILSIFKEQIVNSLTTQQKKITCLALAVISALAVIYLISYHFCSSHTVRPLPTEDKNSEKELDSQIKDTKNHMLWEIRGALKTMINHIHSAKFFINIKSGHSVDKKEYIIKKEDGCFDEHFLSKEMDAILTNVKASIEIDKIIPDISWQVILKDEEAEFYHASGSKDRNGFAVIDTGKIQEFWKIYSDQPLLNEQMEFI